LDSNQPPTKCSKASIFFRQRVLITGVSAGLSVETAREINDDTPARGRALVALNPARAEELWRQSEEMAGERFLL
jgi:hypothetical protein